MSEADIERRITKNEMDIDELYKRTNAAAIEQAKTNTTLDNILVTLGRLEGAVSALQNRPGTLWDKVLTALISAAVAGFVAYVIA